MIFNLLIPLHLLSPLSLLLLLLLLIAPAAAAVAAAAAAAFATANHGGWFGKRLVVQQGGGGGECCDAMLHPVISQRISRFSICQKKQRFMVRITPVLLRQQDDVCNTFVLELLRGNESFKSLATREGEMIIRRDREDDEKLAVGIDIAKAKGILSGDPHVGDAVKINTVGKTAQQVTEELLPYLPSQEGNIIVMQGLSGTGKGTTVKKLQSQLPRCVTWSNGNVFRSYTYLILEELKWAHLRSEHLTAELLRAVEQQVTFKQLENGEFDIILKGEMRAGDIQNTLLKMPEVGNAVPTVAQQMQGEVIRFAVEAIGQLSKAGHNVILEGRAQTLNYIPTPLRFELVMDNPTLLGERRAAQRVMAKALLDMKDQLDGAGEAETEAAVMNALMTLQ